MHRPEYLFAPRKETAVAREHALMVQLFAARCGSPGLAALSGGHPAQARRLRNGAPFAELPAAFRALQQRMLTTPGGDREMVEILAPVLQHDEQAVLAAVELALEAGAPTKTHILNLLHRLVDGKPIEATPVKTPQALALTSEPRADVERYDALRKAREARHAS